MFMQRLDPSYVETLNVWLGTKPTNVEFGTIKVSCIDWAGKMDFGGNEYIGIR